MTTITSGPGQVKDMDTLSERIKTLTRREAEVMEYIIQGLSNDQIALTLFRSVKTIDKHCQSIYQKTGIHKRVILVREVLNLRNAASEQAPRSDLNTTEAVEALVQKSTAWDKLKEFESLLARSAGVEYFGDLSKALAQTFGVKMAGICEVNTEEGTGVIIAFCVDGELQTPFQYDLSNSACGIAHTEGKLEQFENLIDRFGDEDCLLVDQGYESYIGIRLEDRMLGPIGTLWIADEKPIEKSVMPLEILRLFAPSVAAVLATQKALDNQT